MSDFIKLDPKDFDQNPFTLIGKQWMLITAKNGDKVNAMTASWGGLGVMWNKNVAYVVIRPQRYTKEFVDASDSFSLCFLGEDYRKTLNYFGTVSGRDEDKIKEKGLTVLENSDIPYFEESEIVIFCKKLFRQHLTEDSFIDLSFNKTFYPNSDHHYLYISEITEILKKG